MTDTTDPETPERPGDPRKRPCACGKAGFTSERAVRTYFHKMRQQFRLGTYRCEQSGLWHATNRDKARGASGRDSRGGDLERRPRYKRERFRPRNWEM